MKRAFTILELVFVVIILGILVAIALPKLSSSKDEAQISKSLNNLKTLINDISVYALKNDNLSTLSTMSNVNEVENIQLKDFSGVREVYFRVGEDKECLMLVFVSKDGFVLMGIASNDASKNAVIDSANGTKINFESIDFTSPSKTKVCVALSKNANFKNLASKTYILIGAM